MNERPDVLLGALLLTAATAGAALVTSLVEIGPRGMLGVGAVALGVVTACFLFAFEVRHLPPALIGASVLVVGSSIAFALALIRVWREQLLLRRLPRIPIAEGDVPVDIVPSATANAFCAGVIRPRVLITEGLLERLDEDELRAAVMHELEHARARGPLKVALAHIATRTFFWVPAFGDLLDRYVLVSELAADRAAISATSRSALAGALSEVIDGPPRLAGAVALADFAAPRIDRLFDPRADLPPMFRRSSLLAAAAALGVIAFVLLCSPHLGLPESAQLHAMSVNLLAHRLNARLIGLGETVALLSAALVLRRRLVQR